ncbi:MAG: NTP transferase domain-containing protein [Bacteroidetes bacterium]|nr:NTP transferase domain-containing protein [Bacteroidota bacterium]
MHIVIPMTGLGQRFVDAGYTLPKPLIEVEGMPIIQHVVNMFPGETRFSFICRQEHLDTTPMREVLQRIAPQGRILPHPGHKKGPVFAVAEFADEILDDAEEVIVNYCDFGKWWDYAHFLKFLRARRSDGAVPAYRGFHPHMLGKINYAFMRDDGRQRMLEIREKQPFTDDRMREYASDGTYYFRTGAILKKYFRQLMAQDVQVNGEYYVSMVMNLLVADGLRVDIYEIQHMLQWGTPGELEEYLRWSQFFRRVLEAPLSYAPQPGSRNLIPLAGRGSRFANEGYTLPKPLIPVGGKPMIVQAGAAMPPAEQHTFVCLQAHLDTYPQLEKELRAAYPACRIVPLEGVTEGQACTVELGLQPQDMEYPLCIAASDNAMLYDRQAYRALAEDPAVDAIVWTFRDHPSAQLNPQMYGWVKTTPSGEVTGVSVKVPISDNPRQDHAIVGAFSFRKARFFQEGLQYLYDRNERVNGEFYADSVIGALVALGYRVRVFEVADYIGWGTPDDLRTYEYWQSLFHKVPFHPYTVEKDPMVVPSAASGLAASFYGFDETHNPV